MSLERREALIDKISEKQPSIRNFLKDAHQGMNLLSGWEFSAFSFETGFEAMWDLARADNRGLMEMPLLSLWRQSIELNLKSAIIEIGGDLNENSGHDLIKLFKKLVELSSEQGLCNDDGHTQSVQKMIEFTQSFDRFSDRFRYPSNKHGEPYKPISIDLDKLFQAHFIIVSYCVGTCVELGR